MAVVLVVVYHAGVPQVRGGFVGVDVFFVISGFLITGILVGELGRQGTISLSGFYARRFARIVPSLALVTVVTLLAGLAILSPTLFQTQTLAKSAFLTMLFAGNLYFYAVTGDYFAPSAEELPLLHTWSLGVEEQYYLVWPLILILAGRLARGKHTLVACRLAIAVVTLGSLALCAGLTPSRPAMAFYTPLPRFWELGAGSMLAMAQPGSGPLRRGGALAGAGLALIALAAVVTPSASGFPFPFALLPVAGTMLLIAGNGIAPDNPVAKCLSFGPIVRIGTLSYAWYLWHWPPLAYSHVVWAGTPPAWLSAACVAGSLVAAQLTVSIWELPLRLKARTLPPRRVLAGGFAAIGLVCVLSGGAWVAARKGWLPDDPRIAGAFLDHSPRQEQCLLRPESSLVPPVCLAEDGRPRIIAWGDSHGDQWVPGLAKWAELHPPWQVEQLTKAACPPLADVVPGNASTAEAGPDQICAAFNRQSLARILARREPGVVVIASNWAPRAGVDIRELPRGIRRAWFDSAATGPAQSVAALDKGLSSAFAALAAHRIPVILVLQSPIQDRLPEICVIRLGSASCFLDARRFRFQTRDLDARMRAVASRYPNVTVLDPAQILCGPDSCPASIDGRIAYYDRDHITGTTARSAVSMAAWTAAIASAQAYLRENRATSPGVR